MKRQIPRIASVPLLLTAVGIAVILSASLVILIPAGEAPDEPAHVAYLDHLLRHGTLPPVGGPADGFPYEAYQPPLPYLVMTAPLFLLGEKCVCYPFTPNPDFEFLPNQRAFLPAPLASEAAGARQALWIARSSNLAWLVVAVAAILLTCLRLTHSPWIALAAGLPFALSPQLLFSAATVGNDAAVTALVAATTACLVRLSLSPDVRWALVTSALAGVALWAKASAVIVAPAIAFLSIGLMKSRRFRVAWALLLPGAALSAAWVVLDVIRTGSALPSPPTGWSGGAGLLQVFAEPRWLLSAWGSFWAKLGWFNVVLPWPVYLVFLPPSVAAIVGFYRSARPGSSSRVGITLTVMVVADVLLLLLYMIRVDWQPQGRYLLPGGAAVAGLAALGLDHLCRNLQPRSSRLLALASLMFSIGVAAEAVFVVASVY